MTECDDYCEKYYVDGGYKRKEKENQPFFKKSESMIREINTCEDFHSSRIKELNSLSGRLIDENGKSNHKQTDEFENESGSRKLVKKNLRQGLITSKD